MHRSLSLARRARHCADPARHLPARCAPRDARRPDRTRRPRPPPRPPLPRPPRPRPRRPRLDPQRRPPRRAPHRRRRARHHPRHPHRPRRHRRTPPRRPRRPRHRRRRHHHPRRRGPPPRRQRRPLGRRHHPPRPRRRPRALTLTAPIEVHDGDRHLIATPAPALHLDVTIDFPLLGRHRYQAPLTAFAEAAPARTFGFAADLTALHAADRARGATLDNTLAYDLHGRPLTPLRFPDEPARHKWIDLLGDLALLGRPLHAHITAHKPGHALHHRLITRLRDLPAPPRS
ncbi:MAG: UDP-3-O-acyl-N-acetylglucosamine deacetylase [Myxococcales bacterium]|nr:UDP-3-O-acyl-N-acetylglucosamine deacetylase [Myxococcales bacterium]